jgi:hypothetical protein
MEERQNGRYLAYKERMAKMNLKQVQVDRMVEKINDQSASDRKELLT